MLEGEMVIISAPEQVEFDHFDHLLILVLHELNDFVLHCLYKFFVQFAHCCNKQDPEWDQ